jgi:hypothetical protein
MSAKERSQPLCNEDQRMQGCCAEDDRIYKLEVPGLKIPGIEAAALVRFLAGQDEFPG